MVTKLLTRWACQTNQARTQGTWSRRKHPWRHRSGHSRYRIRCLRGNSAPLECQLRVRCKLWVFRQRA